MSLSAVSSYQPSSLMMDTLVPTLPTENAVTAAEAAKARANPDTKQLTMFAEGDEEMSFWDILDVINPLQHIPIVNNLYREATGDTIGVAARLAGGTLFGGPLGLIASAANCILEESTGHDVGGHMIALFRDEDPAATGTGTALAATEEKAPAPEAQAARLEESMPQQSQVLAAAAQPEAKVSDSKATDATRAQPLIMPDLVGGDSQPAASAAALKPVAAASAAAPVQTATEQVAAAANRPMPLGREPRLMPIPGRTTPLATQSPPAIGTTVSGTGYRSNAPIAGHRPNAQRAASAAMAQQMVAAQADSSSVQGGASGAQTGDWFSASMMQAMDKYEKSSRLGRPASSTVTEP